MLMRRMQLKMMRKMMKMSLEIMLLGVVWILSGVAIGLLYLIYICSKAIDKLKQNKKENYVGYDTTI